MIDRTCWKCRGAGCLPRLLVDCTSIRIGPGITGGGLCPDHWQHYSYDRRCWACLGSGRADVFTLGYRAIFRSK